MHGAMGIRRGGKNRVVNKAKNSSWVVTPQKKKRRRGNFVTGSVDNPYFSPRFHLTRN